MPTCDPQELVFKSVPEATTRLAMLKRGEVDIAYLLDTPIMRAGLRAWDECP